MRGHIVNAMVRFARPEGRRNQARARQRGAGQVGKWIAIGAAATGLMLAAPALADVKSGVDAWMSGNYKAAVEQWRPLAIKGDADAQFNLGQAYKLGRGVPFDQGLAEQWFGRAAAQGHPQAQTNYAIALFQNGKRDEAVPWLEKSVARGDPRAQLILGTMLFNGDGVARDWPRAYALMTRASAAGIAKASETLAQMDQHISTEDRQRGIALARQIEAGGQPAQPPAELAGGGSAVRPAELPASVVAADKDTLPRPPSQPVAAAKRPAPRPAPAADTAAPPAPPARATVKSQPLPPAAAAARGGWRVQLGAFANEANAKGLWEALKAKAAAVRPLQPYLVKAGPLTRLQAGPLVGSAEAARLCAAVRSAVPGTTCLPVAP